MKKLQSIRAEAETFQDLKLLAAVNELSMGEMLDRLVRDEIQRHDRAERAVEIAKTARQSRKNKRGY